MTGEPGPPGQTGRPGGGGYGRPSSETGLEVTWISAPGAGRSPASTRRVPGLPALAVGGLPAACQPEEHGAGAAGPGTGVRLRPRPQRVLTIAPAERRPGATPGRRAGSGGRVAAFLGADRPGQQAPTTSFRPRTPRSLS